MYLEEAVNFGPILGLFVQPPIKNLHVSPFMMRVKPGAPHRQIIVDLSFHVAKSVNAGVIKDIYLETPYQLTLPTIDIITSQVTKLGRAVLSIK